MRTIFGKRVKARLPRSWKQIHPLSGMKKERLTFQSECSIGFNFSKRNHQVQ
jgi:hypothetical protein